MADGERDLRVTIRVRNARILRRIEAQGETVASFCRKYQLPMMSVHDLIRMVKPPIVAGKGGRPGDRDADWKPLAWFLASALRCEPEDLWPEWMKALERRRSTISFDASVEELKQVEMATDHGIDLELLPKILEAATDRQKTAMLEYFDGGKTLDDIGAICNTTRERARQIILQGMRKARTRARNLHMNIDGTRS
jgi:lambda repressor-like predicted transcriptional regulator